MKVALRRRLGSFTLDIAFETGPGITALFGPSGAGKSATIGLIAGLMRPDEGRIELDGEVLVDTATGRFLPKHRRRIGVVFQDALLFPHLNVRRNLLFGRWFAPRGSTGIPLEPVVEALGIGHLLTRAPLTLSGGERQRVGIGRALLANPRLLLLDEPLAALDRERKLEILPLIERVRDAFGVPMLYVSHAVDEVARLANSVVMLEAGRVCAVGAPSQVFGPGRPVAGEDRFARTSVVEATIAGYDAPYGLTEIGHPAGTIWLAGPGGEAGRKVRLVIRATDVTLATSRPRNTSVRTALTGTVSSVDRGDGPLATVEIALDGHGTLHAMATRRALDDLGLDAGDRVHALIKTVALDERAILR